LASLGAGQPLIPAHENRVLRVFRASKQLKGDPMAEMQQETAAWRRQSPSRIAWKCEELNDGSSDDIVASRLSRQEIKHVCDDLAVRLEIEGGGECRLFQMIGSWREDDGQCTEKKCDQRQMKVF
jgi:hypothetical protein